MDEIADGIRRLTLPLPVAPWHVHCYLLAGADGWTLVDSGLGLPEVAALLERELAALEAPVVRIVVTHFHPDHVGGAEPARTLTGAGVYEGELDYAQCARVWGSDDWPARIAAWFRRNGVPPAETEELRARDEFLRPLIYLNSTEKFPLSVGLRYFNNRGNETDPMDHLLMAAAVMVTLPCLVLFFCTQRYFVKGVVTSGIKG